MVRRRQTPITNRRIEQIEGALERIAARTTMTDLTPNHTLACGNVVNHMSVSVDHLTIAMAVTLDGVPGHVRVPAKTFVSRHEMALYVQRFLTEARLCKECATLEVLHDCTAAIQAPLFGNEVATCTICLEACLGTTSLRCGHAFHKTCSNGIRERCPNCRTEFS